MSVHEVRCPTCESLFRLTPAQLGRPLHCGTCRSTFDAPPAAAGPVPALPVARAAGAPAAPDLPTGVPLPPTPDEAAEPLVPEILDDPPAGDRPEPHLVYPVARPVRDGTDVARPEPPRRGAGDAGPDRVTRRGEIPPPADTAPDRPPAKVWAVVLLLGAIGVVLVAAFALILYAILS